MKKQAFNGGQSHYHDPPIRSMGLREFSFSWGVSYTVHASHVFLDSFNNLRGTDPVLRLSVWFNVTSDNYR